MIMDIAAGNTFIATLPPNSQPVKIHLEKIYNKFDGGRVFHYTYYSYHSKDWRIGMVDEAEFMHMISRSPRRKRKRRKKRV